MVRTVYSPQSCLQYLEQYASSEVFVIGLIMGQTTDSKDNVIHLARTPEEKGSDNSSDINCPLKTDDVRNLASVSEMWIADHAKHVTRMLPGGMYVLGIFIISDEDTFEDPNQFSKVKGILNYTYKMLSLNKYMFGNSPDTNERLALHMSTSTKVLTCKSIEVGIPGKVVMKPVEWKFQSKPQPWQRLDCYYEFDEIYPVVVKKSGISVKQQFEQILESSHKTIETSVMFIDGELRDENETLDQLVKKKKTKTNTKSSQQEALTPMMVSLFVPYEISLPETVEYLECDGSIHFSGVVASRVFLPAAASVAAAAAAVRRDVVRSLAARFTMHCDALIDDNLLPEEKVCFNEPPRRVLVPASTGGAAHVQLSDYLFPGEAPAEALLSVRELLDLRVAERDVIADLETPADTSEFDALDEECGEPLLATPREASQLMYVTGACCAMLVLLVSIIVHYYDDIVQILTRIIRK